MHYHARAKAIAAAEGIMKILATEIPGKSATIAIDKTQDFLANTVDQGISISFNRVTCAYNQQEKNILQDISFSIAAAEHIYVVGASGAGKTTLLNLVMGFIQPTSGEIKINGTNLLTLSRAVWLRQIAWLGQTPNLFSGSLLDNLLIAKQNASADELQQALSAANIYSFVAGLPKGMNTQIGEQGVGLSGGQIQRIALARAFLKNSKLLLLDEPTANLDQQSEVQVLAALDKFSKNRTVMTLTHRLN